jgi:polyribonucleotide nucleotidyltransferase
VNEMLVGKYYHDVEKEAVRRVILDEAVRLDGGRPMRSVPSGVRWITCLQLTVLPYSPAGETQSITTVTLGTKMDAKLVDDVMKKGNDKFLLHYNFPPFPQAMPVPPGVPAAGKWDMETWHTGP